MPMQKARRRRRRVVKTNRTRRSSSASDLTSDFMGWEMPWYSAKDSLDTLLVGRRVGMMHIVCFLRQGSKVFETYWTTIRGVEAMDNSLPVARLNRLRAAGDVGGLAARLATTV